MPTVEYWLFRVKMIRPSQRQLFADPNLTPGELFVAALQEHPALKVRQNIWRVANLEHFGDSKLQGRFAVGTIKSARFEVVDRLTGDFVEAEFETAPYTYCLFDATIGLLGVAKKQTLTPYVSDIVKRIQTVLENSFIVIRNDIKVMIDPIRDPSPFLSKIRQAYRVSRYRATFTGPNPFDADEYFQRPLSVLCQKTSAVQGRVELQGDNLDREVLQEVSRSTVASGNTASATIKEARNGKSSVVRTGGDPLKRKYDASYRPEEILKDLIELYAKVRHSQDADVAERPKDVVERSKDDVERPKDIVKRPKGRKNV
jgi:hypothetical protein